MLTCAIQTPAPKARHAWRTFGVIATAMAAGGVHAATIVSTFGAGYTYGFGAFYTALDFGAPAGVVEFDIASKFSTGASAYTLDSVRLAVVKTVSANPDDDFTMWLMADNAGKPGAIIESVDYTGPVGIYGSNVLVNAAGSTVLAANTSYWIGIGSTFPDSVHWYVNDIGLLSEGAMAFLPTGGSWTLQNNPRAFEVNGTVIPTTVPVPEPGTLALVAVAMAALRARPRLAAGN